MTRSWQKLRAERPRRPFVLWSVRLLGLIILVSWLAGGFQPLDWLSERRLANLGRFLNEIRPWPLQGEAWSGEIATRWAAALWHQQGAKGLLATFALSLAAITGAGFLGAVFSLPAARNLATSSPFLEGPRPSGLWPRMLWQGVVNLTRAVLIFLRAIPEYIWAFLLLTMLGPQFWPLVLALVLHNTGILGKLGAEVIENTSSQAPGALRAQGAGRLQIALAALFPLTLPRYLLYFFYRWETCVREATVLGMLGVSSLGFLIVEARARNRYDEMMFYIGLGVILVLVGDLVSALVRKWVRSA
jgi:phosphonate transport system permease protein|nr:ABC transporter permease subunit [Candidatus Krumholzibacteria bacterium]